MSFIFSYIQYVRSGNSLRSIRGNKIITRNQNFSPNAILEIQNQTLRGRNRNQNKPLCILLACTNLNPNSLRGRRLKRCGSKVIQNGFARVKDNLKEKKIAISNSIKIKKHNEKSNINPISEPIGDNQNLRLTSRNLTTKRVGFDWG